MVLFKSFFDFFSGTYFHANYFSIFLPVRFFYGKKMIKVVAVAEVGDNSYRGRRLRSSVTFHFVAVAEVGDKYLSQSPTLVAGCFEFCRGRRSQRQNTVAVADFGLRLLFRLSRSPKSATKSVAVADFGRQ